MRLLTTISALALTVGFAACQPATESASTMKEETSETNSNVVSAQDAPPDHPDTRLWLEEVEGERALEWVKAQNRRAHSVLNPDPNFKKFYDQALAIVNATDKIAYGAHRGGYVYNFWQDEANTHGLWRRTSLEDYANGSPTWDVILDLDALSEAEGENWVYKGVDCLAPQYERCIISLSRGGKDASVRREFDIASKSFVEDGFILPEAKGGTAWEDENTLLVATDWGGDTMTDSGYPFVDKRWSRGTALESATEVVRGQKTDVGVWPFNVEMGEHTYMFASEADTFYDTTYWWLPPSGEPVKMPLPSKSSFRDVFKGQAIISLEEDWTPKTGGQSYAKGSLVSFDLEEFMASKAMPAVQLVVAPDDRSAIGSVGAAQSALVVNMLQNVSSVVYAHDFNGEKWSARKLELPENGAISITSLNAHSDILFANVEGFLRPDTLLQYNLADDTATQMYALPDRFDTADLKVEQREATSKDGTKVPYFIIHHKDMPHDGTTPTLLYGYGGFEISMRPSYSGPLGKLWLENGGAYVLANIRGGGEFGPKWHQAGLKMDRQRIYDDFIAVAENLIEHKVTSPKHLGIRGGSNGGLLMGVMYTQRPDLFNAVLCQVPLLDMLRFNQLLAGASWMGEYGDPSDPDEGAFLRTISPYHNVDAATEYPQIFLMTSTKDDRVHPGHARKFGKLLEDLDKDFLYYENIDGGHSAAANLKETARREALGYTYLMSRLKD